MTHKYKIVRKNRKYAVYIEAKGKNFEAEDYVFGWFSSKNKLFDEVEKMLQDISESNE